MKKFLICKTIILLIPLLLFADLKLRKAPLNPGYIKFKNELETRRTNNLIKNDHYLGYIPPPFKPLTSVPTNFNRKRVLPDYYDLRNTSYLTTVKDQGTCGACWTFATYGSIESRWLEIGLGFYDLSENNLNYGNGFDIQPCLGGNCWMSTAYLARGDGPISEADDPYQGGSGSYHPGLIPIAYIPEAHFLPDDMDVIKQSIYDYGAVYTTMHWNEIYYNDIDYTYYYSGSSETNHAILLVGWDDSKSTAGGTGAWIIRNSWGTSWGDNGFFYISYNDSKINSEVAYWPKRNNYEPKEIIHYYDKLGSISSLGFTNPTCYAVIKYNFNEDQQLIKIGSWINTSNSTINFEIYGNFNGTSLSNYLGSINTQTCDFPGYYTYELTEPINFNKDDVVYIKAYYNTPGNNYPVPVENYEQNYADPFIESGKCWLSNTGTSGTWTALGYDTVYHQYDLCIKIYGLGEETEDLGHLAGTVTDAVKNDPIEGAVVSIAEMSDVTDYLGNYLIENIPTGILFSEFQANSIKGIIPFSVEFADKSTEITQTLTASAQNYLDFEGQVEIIADSTVIFDISLSQGSSSKSILDKYKIQNKQKQFPKNNKNIISWTWDFGDGYNTNQQNPTHTYEDPGQYTVSLTISDGTNYDTKTKTDYINAYPTTNIIWPGDTDYNGVVELSDVDPIGVNWKSSGNPRPTTSFTWTSFDYPGNWAVPLTSLADCNGDGIINITDVLAICLNWNKTHQTSLANVNIPEDPEPYKDNFIEIYNSLNNYGIEAKIKNHIANYFDLPVINSNNNNYIMQNYPNPFNISTRINYSINSDIHNGYLKIYNIKGQLVHKIYFENAKKEENSIIWNGQAKTGNKIANGIYFYKIETDNWSSRICKMVKMK